MSEELLHAADGFVDGRQRRERRARQRLAVQLCAGADLDTVLHTRGLERRRIALRLARLVERERLKGARGHWSYDLNRHIALKQALEQLRQPE